MPTLTYLVCASPRSGSTLLCEGLSNTFEAGRPIEYFDNRPHVDARYKGRLRVDTDAAYFDALLREATTGNGVCGLKVHWHQRLVMERVICQAHEQAAATQPGLSLAAFQAACFGDVRRIWLRRRDQVAQAISLYRASRSDIWHVVQGKTPPRELDALEYDFDKIDFLVHACFRYDTSWGKYFQQNKLDVLEVFYEDLVADHAGTIAAVLDHLGLGTARQSVTAPTLARLAGTTSRQWADTYRKDKIVWLQTADLRAA